MSSGLRSDGSARVPFSLVAITALLLAGAGAAFVAATEAELARADLQIQQMGALRTVAGLAHRGVEVELHALALEALRAAAERPGDPALANRELGRLVEERLRPSFPRTVRGFDVSLDGIEAALFLRPMRTLDVVPAPEGAPRTNGNVTSEALDLSRPADLRETSRGAYLTLLGSTEVTVRREAHVHRERFPIEATVDSPLPLLQGTARGLAAAADGSGSELARIVRYILTTAAQYRALQGFAAGAYGEPGTSTVEILGPEDVEVAVNLALLLEELRRFRDVDDASPAALDAAHYLRLAGRFLGTGLLPDAADRTIARLLETYARGGSADPADLFALYAALDADPVRLNRVLAQALAALADQQVLRIFEYYGVEWLADFGVEIAEALAGNVEWFLSWITAGQREAELVRGFVRELFRMAGEPATLLGPYVLDLPLRAYDATNGDGTTVPIEVPAHGAPLPFPTADLLAGRDDLWRAYHATLFAEDLRAVHASARDFLTDLAATVAEDLGLIGAIPNPSLRGAIDPKESESILDFVREELDAAVGEALLRLREDPGYVEELIGNLWRAQAAAVRGLLDYILEHYDEIVSGYDAVLAASAALATDLEARAMGDPDYPVLDAEGLASLRAAIAADIATNGWAALAYFRARLRDEARLDRVYVVATDVATPPEGGGIYRRLQETVVGATGVLARAGEILREYGDALAAGQEVHNTEIRVPTPSGPFEFWTGDRDAAASRDGIRREGIVVRQTPAVLRATRVGGSETWDPAELREGDLWIEVRDPGSMPVASGSPNVHWTDISSASKRPFETRWEVRVAGLVMIAAESERGVRLGPQGHVPEVAGERVRLDLSVSVTVYTGWPLEGVAYANSNTFAGDVWAALKGVLDLLWEAALEPIVDRILDAVESIIGILADLVHRLLDTATDVVRALSEAVRVTVDALQDLALHALSPLRDVVDRIAGDVPANGTFQVLGLNLSVGPGTEGKSVRVTAWRDHMVANVTLVVRKMPAPGVPLNLSNAPVDLLFGWTQYADALTLSVEGDALAITQGKLVTARGVPRDGGWALEITVPAIDAYRTATPWEVVLPPVPTPFGTLTLSIGAEVRYDIDTKVDWLKVLGGAFLDALGTLHGIPASWQDVTALVQAFLERLIGRLVDLLVGGIVKLGEFLLYLEGVLGAGTAAGAGFRLAFVIDGEFVVRILRWVLGNALAFLMSLPDPGSAHYEEFPRDLADFLSLRVEAFATVGLPRSFLRATTEEVPSRGRLVVRVQASVPALANAWHPEWGTWRVEFGAYLEQVPAAIADAMFGTGSATPDVWFLRGAVYELPP